MNHRESSSLPASRLPSNEQPQDAVRRLDTEVDLINENIFDIRMTLQRMEDDNKNVWAQIDRFNERDKAKRDRVSGMMWSTLTSIVKWFMMLALAGLGWFVKKALEHE